MNKLYQSDCEMYYVKETVSYAFVSDHFIQIKSILSLWILCRNRLETVKS